MRSENAEYGSEDHTGGMGRLRIGYKVEKAVVTVRGAEVEATSEAVVLDGSVMGRSETEVEEEDLRDFDEEEEEPDFDSRRFDLSLLL